MSCSGDLFIGALGTVPNLFTPPRAEARPINYEESDVEMAKLNSQIKNIQSQEPAQIMTQGRVVMVLYFYSQTFIISLQLFFLFVEILLK